MTTRTTSNVTPEEQCTQTIAQETTKHWFSRHRLNPIQWHGKGVGEKLEVSRQLSLERPRTAPSTGTATPAVVPPLPTQTERLSAYEMTKAPTQPPRPDSGVIRDVNAWLDASLRKSASPVSPLMAGISYWREGPIENTGESTEAQYAIPIAGDTAGQKTAPSHAQQLRYFYHRAKKLQVRMPSLRKTTSQRASAHKTANRRSASTPLLAVPYEKIEAGSPPAFLTRFCSASQATSRTTTAAAFNQTTWAGGWFEDGQGSLVDLPLHHGSPESTRLGEPEYNMERRINAVFGHTVSIGDRLRRRPAAANIPREDSMASLSDAPTYFTGLPPPSYRSRAASVLSTSSFGCIDGLNPEQRQISKQRAAQRHRGMKGKLRKLAQRAHLTKKALP